MSSKDDESRVTRHRTRSSESGHWIFRPTRTDPKTGKVYVAAHYGRKAWPIWVPDDDGPADPSATVVATES